MFSATELAAQLERHKPPRSTGYLIGLSGGADSAALLAAAAQLRTAGSALKLRAVHVDHGLQPSAGPFRAHCADLCRRLAVPLRILEPRHAAPAPPTGESIEAFARRLRYAAFAADLETDECLLTAHHREDQAETFLLQAMRGAGLKGLAAMPVLRPLGTGWHLRPLLPVMHADLEAFCAQHAIQACADPMNADDRFDRVYLRREIWPRLTARWPEAGRALSASARRVAEAQQLIEAQNDADLALLRDGDTLSIAALRVLPEARRYGALRRWIAAAGLRVPSSVRLGEAIRQFCTGGADRAPSLSWDGATLRRYRERIYLSPGESPQSVQSIAWSWREQAPLPLFDACGASLGRMVVVEQPGGLRSDALPASLQLHARRGGERLRPGHGARSQSVQHLLQARGVVPWLRAAIPFLYAGEKLIAVADFWLAAEHCVPEAEMGVAFVWEHDLPLE